MTLDQAKEIAFAFGKYVWKNPTYTWEIWLETEEGKRLTAEEPDERDAIIERLKERPITQALTEIKQQLQRIDERMDKMNGNLFAE